MQIKILRFLSFQFVYLGFFHIFVAIAKTSSTILNKYLESGQSCPVPGFSVTSLNFSQFKLMLVMDLL